MGKVKTIALVGGKGQVGWDLQRSVASLGHVVTLGRDSKKNFIDLSQPDSIKTALRELNPDIIINASAYTAVDKAEEDESLARSVNTTAAGIFAEQANKHNALLVHYSTDYVFNGESKKAYIEDDKPAPINVYGETKLGGDLLIQEIAKNYLIFRTSWVYTNRANNFVLTMLNLAKQRNELSIIDDQIGSPTWSRLIADVSANAIYSKCHLNNDIDNGIYNLSSNGETSWCGFAKKIFEYAGLSTEVNVTPIPTTSYPTPAKRPKYTVLSKNKLEENFLLKLPQWEESLKLCINEYLEP